MSEEPRGFGAHKPCPPPLCTHTTSPAAEGRNRAVSACPPWAVGVLHALRTGIVGTRVVRGEDWGTARSQIPVWHMSFWGRAGNLPSSSRGWAASPLFWRVVHQKPPGSSGLLGQAAGIESAWQGLWALLQPHAPRKEVVMGGWGENGFPADPLRRKSLLCSVRIVLPGDPPFRTYQKAQNKPDAREKRKQQKHTKLRLKWALLEPIVAERPALCSEARGQVSHGPR